MSFLSKIKSAKVYEFILWLIFLVVTFFIGFFHGSSPEKQITFYYQDTKNVDILVQQEGILTTSLIKYLEKETHSHINVIVRKSYQDFRTEVIVNKNIILALSPEAFIEPLFNDNRIKNLEPLEKLISEAVQSDFQPQKHNSQVYSLPISWFINVFSPPANASHSTYIDYLFLVNQKKKNHFFQFNKNFSLEHSWTQQVKNDSAFETTLQLAYAKRKRYYIDSNSSFLITFDLVVPNNTPDRKLSMDLLRLILASKEIRTLLTENGLGQTFLDPRINYSVAGFIAPESIRDLDLKTFRNGNKIFDETLWTIQTALQH